MEKLVIVRTNPEQGKPVKVQFRELVEGSFIGPAGVPNEVKEIILGHAEFPFSLWIQFEKLVKDGLEARSRIEPKPSRRIEVEFLPLAEVAETAKAIVLEPGSIPGRKQREAPVAFAPVLDEEEEAVLEIIPTKSLLTIKERLAKNLKHY